MLWNILNDDDYYVVEVKQENNKYYLEFYRNFDVLVYGSRIAQQILDELVVTGITDSLKPKKNLLSAEDIKFIKGYKLK